MPPAVGDIFWFVTSAAFVWISMTDCKRLNPPFNRRRLALGALPNSTSIRLGNGNINHWLIHFGAFHHASLKAMARVALGWEGGIDKFRTSVTKTFPAKTMARCTRYPGY